MNNENLKWRKASKSSVSDQNPDCVEVAESSAQVMLVRDSKNPGLSFHVYSTEAWGAVQSVLRLNQP